MYKVIALIALFAAVANSAELTATIAAAMPWGLQHTVTYYDGAEKMYIMGGWDGLNYDHEIKEYNMSGYGRIEQVASFPTGVAEGCLGMDGEGSFFYLGGDKGGNNADIWKMDSTTLNPTFMGLLPEANRLSCSVSDMAGNVYMIGGVVGNLNVHENIVKYDSKINTATVVARLPVGMYGMSCAMANDVVYIFGGFQGNWTHNKQMFTFTPATGVVGLVENIQFSSNGNLHSSAVVVGQHIYIIGGVTPNGELHHVTKFDPTVMALEHFDVPNHDMLYAGVSTVYVQKTNRIYVVGGFTFENNKTKQLKEIFYFQL